MPDRADPLGYDLDVPTDVRPDWGTCSGAALVRNAVMHRHMEDRLPLVGAPGGYVDFGRDVRRWVGETMSAKRVEQRQAELAMVVARDPRVDPGSIRVAISTTRDADDYDFIITETFRTVEGIAIAMVLGVSAVTVDLLAQGQ